MMRSLWILYALSSLLWLQKLDANPSRAKCTQRLMVLANFRRTMCAPLRAVWVRARQGGCQKGYTCAEGYTEDECIKYCVSPKKKKDTKESNTRLRISDSNEEREEKQLNRKEEEDETVEVSTSSVRTRRPRIKTTTIEEEDEE